ncbi:hypothetical protein Fmac_005961 [Flemingia macrophylla]|uniref:Uncharacterized protein n=1 Tax=Flemingia macrophylla TaxID=520843 RepID=A0ABD1N998_9FABA
MARLVQKVPPIASNEKQTSLKSPTITHGSFERQSPVLRLQKPKYHHHAHEPQKHPRDPNPTCSKSPLPE